MIDTPIVDTHVHLWDPSRLRYPWHATAPAMDRPYLLDDYRQACGPLAIERMVFLECDCDHAQNRDEVAMITELAAVEPRLEGIVAFAPLENGGAVRDELAALAANPLVKGIRRITQQESDPDFCSRPDFVAGVKLLPAFGLTCDLCIRHHQLPDVIRLVRACGEVGFILDHIGKPDIRAGGLEPWAAHLRELSSLPNVSCKLSGVVTEADTANWTYDDIRPFMQAALDCFGADRLLYGGDWPVVTLAAEYSRWAQCVERFMAPLSQAERQKILHDNAVAFYRLATTA